MKTDLGLLILCLSLLALTACAAPASAPPSPTSAPTTPPTETPTPPPTPSPTQTPAPTPTLAGTLEPFPFPPDAVWNSTYFTDTSICDLPCWNGLIVGESTVEDVQTVMQEVFGLSEIQAIYASESGPADIPELERVEYSWSFQPLREGPVSFDSLFSIVFWVEHETGAVRRIGVGWVNGSTDLVIERSLADVLLAGRVPPELITLQLQITEHPDFVSARIRVVYEDGRGADYNHILSATEWNEGSLPTRADFCLNYNFEGGLGIVEPFLDDLGKFDAISEYLIGNPFESTQLEEVTDFTPDELYDLAINDPNACIPVTIN